MHNDDVNEMGHVVRALLESVPELTPERPREVMLEAHARGAAEVIRCPLQRGVLLERLGVTDGAAPRERAAG